MGWAKILVLYCDTDVCDEELEAEGRQATKDFLVKTARSIGWVISHDGRVLCQECVFKGDG